MKKILAGNWKMNQTQSETRRFFSALAQAIPSSAKPSPALELRLFAPTLSLETALGCARELETSTRVKILIGAQNVHWESRGAFTGEVSGPMVQEIGIQSALVGHSERRQFFGETDQTVRRRMLSLLEQGFAVMVCIGENRSERESGRTLAVLETQMRALLEPLESPVTNAISQGRLSVAYEPVWAIGTGLTASPEQAQEAHTFIRQYFPRTPILYGGSVTPQNLPELLAKPNIDGALVGGASLKPESFQALWLSFLT